MKKQTYYFFILSIFLFFACTDDTCNTKTDTDLRTEIFVASEELTGQGFIDSLSVYSPEWADSIHYSKEGIGNSLYFSLSPEKDETQIIITSKKAGLKDTLDIYYTKNYVLLSPACGFVVNYTIDSLKNTIYHIDSLAITEKEITTEQNGHIKIYF